MLEWGFYEDKNPRLVDPEDIGNPEKTMGSDSMRYLDLEEVAEPLRERLLKRPLFSMNLAGMKRALLMDCYLLHLMLVL